MNFALCITCLFIANMAHTTTLKQSSLPFQSYNVGARVTLPCVCEGNAVVMFYWYKYALGEKPKLMSTFYKHNNNGNFHNEFNNNSRFSLDTENGANDLKISDLQISDSATYYCIGSNLLDFKFCEGATVNVKGSGLNIPALIQQSESESIQPGGSVNCTVQTGTCDGEHRVYWFRNSEESHPGLIYTHGGSDDQCEKKPNTQTQTCVYNLPMKSLDLSQDGTYYCAVVSCGHILFGNGTKLDSEDEVDSPVLVNFLSGALAFTTTLVVILAFLVCKMNQKNSQYRDNVTFSATSAPNTALYQDAGDLHYAALENHTSSRSRRQRDDTLTECVYSGVRQ